MNLLFPRVVWNCLFSRGSSLFIKFCATLSIHIKRDEAEDMDRRTVQCCVDRAFGDAWTLGAKNVGLGVWTRVFACG